MAEQERTSQKEHEVDQKHRPKKWESEPLFNQLHAWEQDKFSMAETPFQPQMDTHTALMAANHADEARSNLLVHFQQTYGNRYVQRLLNSMKVQTKLTVNVPNDIYEQEADRVAEEVTKTINSPTQRQEEEEEEEVQTKHINSIQKQEDEEELQMQEEEEEFLQGQTVENELLSVSDDLETRIHSARGGGQPLSDNIRGNMEGAFGADFADVRVHADSEADWLNKELSAKAFTTGKDIFFREGEYRPGSDSGQKLIAHELTHVVQQKEVRTPKHQKIVSGRSRVGLTVAHRMHEPKVIGESMQEADRVAEAVTRSAFSPVQRQEEEEEELMPKPASEIQRQEIKLAEEVQTASSANDPQAISGDFLTSTAPPPTHVVVEEEEGAGSETAEARLPGLDTEVAPSLKGGMKESDEVGSLRESDMLPAAFIDGVSRGEDKVWWVGGPLESNMLPTAFVDSGSTGSDTVYWAGSGATGAQGNQGVGSFQEKVAPVYENEPASEGGKYMAWIRDDTGKVKVERSYVSVKTGANGNDWYITARAKTRIEKHEKGHVNKSKELYESHVKPVEDKVTEVRGKVNAVEGGNSAAKAVKSLKDAVKWDDGIKNFKQKDKDVNKPGGTWDTQEQATADWYYDYGPRSVGTKNYTHYIDQTPGPSSGS